MRCTQQGGFELGSYSAHPVGLRQLAFDASVPSATACSAQARSCRSYTASMRVHAADGLTGKALAFLTADRCLDLRHSQGREEAVNGGVPIPLKLRSHPRQSGKKQH